MTNDKEDNRDIFERALESPLTYGAGGALLGRLAGGGAAKALSKKIRKDVRYGKELVDEANDYARRPETSARDAGYLKRAAKMNKEQFIDGPLRPYRVGGALAGTMIGTSVGTIRQKRK